MSRRRGTGALTASPVLVGSITVLIAIIAVFIAYNANAGLPFVPTYDVDAQVPNAAKLVEGNEVRVGGLRVGVVDKITAERQGGRSVAVLEMKLDKTVEPLAVDSAIAIRPRSALGLKYVELTPGASSRTIETGGTIKLGSGVADKQPPEDLEDVLATFDAQTRVAARSALDGFGSSLAGRGPALNQAIEGLAPFLRSLTPVMKNLNDPRTELRGFIQGLARASAEVAPVARVQGELFANMADTFAAIGRDPVALQQTIEEGPPFLDSAVRSFRVQAPFLDEFTTLSRNLRPAAQEIPRSLPALTRALNTGTPVLRRVAPLNNGLTSLFGALEDLGQNPNTLLALRDLNTTLTVTRPAVEFIAPYQTVCNFATYFFVPLGTHISQPVGGGTTQRILLKMANREQRNSLATRVNSRPVDSATPKEPGPNAPATLHTQYGGPAIDSNGKANCGSGQTGYPVGRLAEGSRYGPNELGGRNIVIDPTTPGRRGGTYKSRQLGIDGLGNLR